MEASNERWFKALTKEFDHSSDRSLIIVAASIIDNLLGEVLKAFMTPSPKENDPLFVMGRGLLGSFGRKIQLAHRLGLISERAFHDFKKISNFMLS